MEQEGFRRIRDRADAGLAQEAAGHVRAVDVKESPDLPGIDQAAKDATTGAKEASAAVSAEYSGGASLAALSGSTEK